MKQSFIHCVSWFLAQDRYASMDVSAVLLTTVAVMLLAVRQHTNTFIYAVISFSQDV